MDEVGCLADVYSLGAILYCLLTARPPFQAASVVDTLKQVCHEEPVSPAKLNVAVDRDLETICLRCLEKEPHRRFPSAQEMGEELGRYLRGEPIHSRRIATISRGWWWCRRHPYVAMTAVLSLLLVVSMAAGIPLIMLQQREITDAAAQQVLSKQLADVPFFPLGDDIMRQIAVLKLGKVARRVKEHYDAELTWSDAVLDHIVSRCTEVDSGARNVDRILTGSLLPEMSSEFLSRMAEGGEIASAVVDLNEDEGFKFELS